ncbi:baseplate hub [Salmonella phage vB_SnwM_CGG4-1]|uniref:Baseplate hub subunit n=1 Tax=Salmonella phage vB_SnwM_CGG4-1 TaxID=1815631 RepID=A0A1B0VVC5_9CAUD|nr:baseplate hub [Salmonella phage vB_SnwM_CGG4-1]ANA49532.1 baseplate hub subunit [Salmonella phage vB_SnwM_CGG4-1]
MNYDYNFEVLIGEKTIECRAFTLEEYKNLIVSKQQGSIKQSVLDLIKNCTNAKNLNKQESELLLVNLWSHSLGEVNHQNTWVCSCGHETQVPINFTFAQIDEPEELWYNLRHFKIKLRYPNLFEDENIASMISSCIQTIHVNGETIGIEDLNNKEIEDLYSAITEDDIINIKNLLLKPTVQLAVPVKCSECGENHVHIIKGLKEFFKLI